MTGDGDVRGAGDVGGAGTDPVNGAAGSGREEGEDTIVGLRDRIAALDRGLLESFAERMELARRIGVEKRRAGDATLDPTREAAVIRKAVGTARELGLPEEPVREIFWTLVGLCRAAQLEET